MSGNQIFATYPEDDVAPVDFLVDLAFGVDFLVDSGRCLSGAFDESSEDKIEL